jgi:hypothetical protein
MLLESSLPLLKISHPLMSKFKSAAKEFVSANEKFTFLSWGNHVPLLRISRPQSRNSHQLKEESTSANE